MSDLLLGTPLQGGNPQDVGRILALAQVRLPLRHVLIALIPHVGFDGLLVVGDPHRILVEVWLGLLAFAHDQDHLILRSKRVVALIVADGAIPDDHVMELEFPAKGGTKMDPGMLPLAMLAEDIEQAVVAQRAVALPGPGEAPVDVGRLILPSHVPLLLQQHLEIRRIGDDELEVLFRELFQLLDTITRDDRAVADLFLLGSHGCAHRSYAPARGAWQGVIAPCAGRRADLMRDVFA